MSRTMGQNGGEHEEPEKKQTKRGFAKIDVVDVILSAEARDSSKATTSFEKLTDTTLNKGLLYAPTFRTEPKRRFDGDVILKILKEYLEKDVRDISYSERECQNACKRISYYIRRAVKQLSYDRYRIICQVRMVEKQNQSIETSTGFLWDSNYDGFQTYCMDAQSFVAQAVVYGVYKD